MPGKAGSARFVTLPPALPGQRIEFPGPGLLSSYVDGPPGRPLLLVHTVNAAASAAEVRPLYEHFRQRRPVFAVDLPGFGFSERSDRRYTPRIMTDALHAAVAMVRDRCGPEPIDALAVSLSCEFLARAAVEAPEQYRRLALVSPTGFRGRTVWRGPPGSTRRVAWLHWLLTGPGWGEAAFRGLTRPGLIRYFLQRTWGSKAIDETLWAYDVLTARQPGAQHAPLDFLSAGLFSADIHTIYDAIRHPVFMCHGVRGDFTDYRGAGFVTGRPNWRLTVYDSGALPYFEHERLFVADYEAFLDGVDQA
jgi:pimeloyl-ACP methyl ester carboxylesterase